MKAKTAKLSFELIQNMRLFGRHRRKSANYLEQRHKISLFISRRYIVAASLLCGQLVKKIYKFKVQNEGGRAIERKTMFRIWATNILRKYLVEGFNLNRYVLSRSKEKIDGIEEAVELMRSELPGGPLRAKVTMRVTKDIT